MRLFVNIDIDKATSCDKTLSVFFKDINYACSSNENFVNETVKDLCARAKILNYIQLYITINTFSRVYVTIKHVLL